jgi:hypothetical protein
MRQIAARAAGAGKPRVRAAECLDEGPLALKLDRAGLRAETMATLCPDAFGVGCVREDAAGALDGPKLLDPAGRMENAREVDEATARRKRNSHPQRVLSVVSCAGSDAYGSRPVDVVVPGYREGAKRYFLEVRPSSDARAAGK